ncbi:hypothetical protein [uncultured Ferrovibrio sp.]|jgi:hypothetical protein|uniref:hypothetical protein n=1 Tax=uncultured Ferrovibrio sp. TaxID=1576913 RepID=UPI00260CD75D|nr:hypothetical protein [uncultured Ferrovibrio sp.]
MTVIRHLDAVFEPAKDAVLSNQHAALCQEPQADRPDARGKAMVDGRMSYVQCKPFKEEVMRRTGLTDRQVKRSLLYRQPDGFVVEIP